MDPAAPYNKPVLSVSETGYAESNLDATGLVASLVFDGVSGISIMDGAGFSDISVAQNHATASNTDGVGMQFVAGPLESAIHLDSVDDYLSIPDDSAFSFSGSDLS